ncbi:hypothetical protein [Streptomyces synnematoformans]|uniref:Uncharacterized protein n=1 Tax=Streptomyces synnematoformans TaxID=415721 RepID=A0ABP5JI55_9ACTN
MSRLPDDVRDFLTAVHDAIDIPHAATVGGDEQYRKVLAERAMHVRIALQDALDDGPLGLAWTTEYLRDRLAENPPTGYVTGEQARAALAEGKTWMQAVRPDEEGVADDA